MKKLHSKALESIMHPQYFQQLRFGYVAATSVVPSQGEPPVSQVSRTPLESVVRMVSDGDNHLADPANSFSLSWSIDVMQRVFASRPELETYAWRIQGAA